MWASLYLEISPRTSHNLIDRLDNKWFHNNSDYFIRFHFCWLTGIWWILYAWRYFYCWKILFRTKQFVLSMKYSLDIGTIFKETRSIYGISIASYIFIQVLNKERRIKQYLHLFYIFMCLYMPSFVFVLKCVRTSNCKNAFNTKTNN